MEKQSVQSLDRTIDIIELLATSPQGMGVTEIGARLSLHKSTVYRLINALARRGYAEKDSGNGTYKIGYKFIEISSLYINQLELKTEAFPFMRRLAAQTGQVTHLAILDGFEVVYIEKIDVVRSLRLYSQIGKRIPIYCTALGKVLLAGQNESIRKSILESVKYEYFTGNTIVDKNILLKQLDVAEKRGWAADNEEYESGIRCIAAPIKDFTGKVIAAVSVTGDKSIVNADKDEHIVNLTVEAALGISKRMGYIT
jgi:DNA-binding IclR family transcriptional regulator